MDVDGVLNKHYGSDSTREKSPMGFVGVDKRYLENLQTLVSETGSIVVLTSDWKDCFQTMDCNPLKADKDGAYLHKRLTDYGIWISEKTDDKSIGFGSSGRGEGIRKYLKAHPEVEAYVILDDNYFSDFTGTLKDYFVHCFSPLGKNNMKKAYKILMGKRYSPRQDAV